MSFNRLSQKAAKVSIKRFANCVVIAKLKGVVVKDFPGIFDEHTEVVQPFESDRVRTVPAVTVEAADFSGVDSGYVLEVVRVDSEEETAKEYRLDGKPRPDGAGLIVVYLGAKK